MEPPRLPTAPRSEDARPARKRRRRLIAAVAAAVALLLVAWGIFDRRAAVSALADLAQEESVPDVTLVSPQPGPKSRTLTLPGDAQPWYEAPIYAQVTGYVEAWHKDYGAAVKKNDLLATISTPDLDQELHQAQAQLGVAQEKLSLAQVTADRWRKLSGTGAVSEETVDVNQADARAQQASVDAAKANVARFQAQEAFKRIVAPFDGVVTGRYTDIGNYVEGTGGNAGQRGKTQELFTVADIDQLRVFVSVPQDYSQYLKPDLTATITVPQFPDKVLHAKLLTTSESFNMTSRSVLTELTLDNPGHEIWPGAYVEVHFDVPTQPDVLVIPEQALLFRAEGLEVALVKDGKVHLQGVTLGLNLGQSVQVTRGLTPQDRLVANPSEGLLEGQAVRVVEAAPDAPAAGPAQAPRQSAARE